MARRKVRFPIAVERICALLLFAVLWTAPALARSWRIADFQTTASIGGDGSALIQERITLVFVGAFQGIHRVVPIEYPGRGGSNYKLFLDVERVTDDQGTPLKFSTKRSGDYLDITIFVPGAVDSTRAVLVTYSTPNAVRYFPDHDEFYWNVTGNDWPVPIDHASALVTLPEAAAGSLRAQGFTGVYGSQEQETTAEVHDNQASFETTNPLPMRGGLTIDIYIPKGVLTEPGALTQIGWFLKSNLILLLPVLALAVMFPMWWVKGRDPSPSISVAPMYEPPPNMSPAEVGTLVNDKIIPRDITSTVIDLAVHGYIKIEQTDEKHLLFSNKDYLFHLLKPSTEWKELRPHERVMLETMFGGGRLVRMSDLKNHFYTAVPIIRHDIFAALRLKGMYTVDSESARGYVVAGAVLIGVPFVLLQVTGVADLFQSVTMAVLGIGLAALIVVLFGRVMPAKSLQGVRTKVRILGFQEFMNRVDAERLKQMPPDTFEKYLAFAMALGVEHRWAQAFAGILTQPPSWYSSPGGVMFNPIFFSNSMHTMATDMHNVMVAAPRSSATGSGFGGGGFSGGGFSGGGFGGGGGSAF